MARKEAIFKAIVDTGSSVNDVKKLDKELDQLNQAMKDLTVNGQTNTQEFKDLQKAYETTRIEVKKFSGDMEHLADDIMVEVTGSISKMEDKLYELALAGKQNTKEFRDLQQKTANYKKVIIETDRSIDSLAERGRGLNTALSISTATVSGFQAYTGVTALLGSENEELLQTITKLQGAQGVLNSIEVIKQQIQNNSIGLTRAQTVAQNIYNVAVGNGTKGMKLFRLALIGTGIGALIVGITALIGLYNSWRDSVSEASRNQKMLNGVMQEAMSNTAKEKASLDTLLQTARNENLSKEERIKAIKKLNELSPEYLGNITLENINTNESIDAISNYVKALNKKAFAQAVANQKTELYEQKIKNATKSIGEFVKENAFSDALFGQAGMDFLTGKDVQGEAIKRATKLKKEENDVIQSQIDALDGLITKKIESGDLDVGDFETTKLTGAGAPKPEKDTSKKDDPVAEATRIANEIAEVEDHLFKVRMSQQQQEEQAINEKYDELFLKANNNKELETQIIEQQETEINAIRKKFLDQEAIDRQEANDLKHSLQRDSMQKDIDIMNEKFELERETLEENMVLTAEEKLILETEILERERLALFEIEEKWRQKGLEAEKKTTDKKKDIQQAYFESIDNGLNAISDLSNLVTTLQMKEAEGNSKQQDKIQRQNFNRAKAVNVAMATMSTIQGVQSAMAQTTTIPEPMGHALKVINAVMVGISGASNVAKIMSSQYKSTSTPTPDTPNTTSAGGGSMGAGAGASSFSISDAVQDITELNDDGTIANTTQQVVVVETDITDAVNNVAQINEVSKF